MNFLDPRLPMRFWDRCIPEPNSGCWLWITGPDRYGAFKVDGKQERAHRVSYVALVGEIPAGLELDHRVCQTPRCVNPAHLEAVTHQVNVARGRVSATNRARGAAVTHCRHGHAFDEGNTIKGGNGRRACKTCSYARVSAISKSRRNARGLSRSHPKMTQADADRIRERRANGERARDIAEDVGVADMTVHDIVAGRTWRKHE